MSVRKSILSLALVGAFAAPAFAAGYATERGEAAYSGPMPGSTTYQMPSAKSRIDVEREVMTAAKNGTLGFAGDYPKVWEIAKGGTTDVASTLTREAVKQELRAFQRNPVTADGYRYVGGEIGYVFVGRQAAQELSARAAAQ